MDYNQMSLKMHEENHGKLEVVSKVAINDRDDLSTAYTPGVAEPCRKIHANPADVYKYTCKANTAIYPYLLTMAVVAAIVAWFIHSRQKRPEDQPAETEEDDSSNPLEFKVALIFAVLFVIFTFLTHYTLVYAGTGGLNLLSFVSGFSDITPFILNLLQNTGSVAALIITACSMQAIISNIMVNMFYALFFAGKGSKLRPWILGGFGVVIACNLVLLLFFYI